jgi:hypothetical protein
MTALTLGMTPAEAIVDGTQDSSNTFSSAGLMVNDGTPWCSGFLYRTDPSATSSTLFMTAAHCAFGTSGPLQVTFDPAGYLDPDAQYVDVVATYTIPSYAPALKDSNSLQNGNDTSDVAVLVLDHAPAGVTPADLPSVGFDDTLDPSTAMVSVVGYGFNGFSSANSPTGGLQRYYSTVRILPGQRTQTGPTYLKTGAAVCFGDSGGPDFLAGTNVVLALNSWVQSSTCHSPAYSYRIDNAEALTFLRDPTTGLTD